MKRFFEAFSPAKPISMSSFDESSSMDGDASSVLPRGEESRTPLPFGVDSGSMLTTTATDEARMDIMRQKCLERIEACRVVFGDILQVQNAPSSTTEFISSLEDGSFLVQLLLKITGTTDRPNKLASFGLPGITAENFDRCVRCEPVATACKRQYDAHDFPCRMYSYSIYLQNFSISKHCWYPR